MNSLLISIISHKLIYYLVGIYYFIVRGRYGKYALFLRLGHFGPIRKAISLFLLFLKKISTLVFKYNEVYTVSF